MTSSFHPKISMIAAIGEHRELGKDNQLLWRIPVDTRRFRDITRGHAVIMGRKTYDSMGKALPQRTNIVITRDKNLTLSDAIVVHSLDEALIEANKVEKDEVFIIGGAQIYTEALDRADMLYLTIVHNTYDADAFFPDYSQFKEITFKEEHTESEPHFTFVNLRK
jgi:dihydrofolate reductase